MDAAPTFDTMVRDHGSITLGEAKQYAQELPPEKRRTACGCYVCYLASSPSCASHFCGCCPVINFCGGCLLYNPFMCACPDSIPGTWTCTDMKGIKYSLVPVDGKGTLAFFSEHESHGHGDALKVSCYCNKVC